MVSLDEVERQLRQIGATFRYWGRSEIRELKLILVPGEKIQGCLNGRYERGFALLCVTDQRLLLVDKKPLYLTLEDLRYDMITEVDYGHRLFDATINVFTPNKKLAFTAYRRNDMRSITNYIQHRVMQIRQHHAYQEAKVAQQLGYQQVPATAAMPFTPSVSAPAPATPVTPEPPQVGQIEGLPLPRFQNPYTKQPMIVRRRTPTFFRY